MEGMLRRKRGKNPDKHTHMNTIRFTCTPLKTLNNLDLTKRKRGLQLTAVWPRARKNEMPLGPGQNPEV
jgi:hypothetical protein